MPLVLYGSSGSVLLSALSAEGKGVRAFVGSIAGRNCTTPFLLVGRHPLHGRKDNIGNTLGQAFIPGGTRRECLRWDECFRQHCAPVTSTGAAALCIMCTRNSVPFPMQPAVERLPCKSKEPYSQ